MLPLAENYPRTLSHGPPAVCGQTDPDLWFPEKGGSAKQARKLCFTCPLLLPCARWAVENDETFGVWGSTTHRQRRRLRREGTPITRELLTRQHADTYDDDDDDEVLEVLEQRAEAAA